MIPVEQTILTPPDGNCMAACIASILELPLDEVPNYYGDGWYERFQDWFHERGYCLISWDHSDSEGHATAVKRIGYAILNAQSPRGKYGHAVVTYGGTIVWDPSPLRDMGVGRYLDWCVIVPLNPVRAPRSAEIWAAAEDSCPECQSEFRVLGRLIHGPGCSIATIAREESGSE